nr:hypothetical protein [Tanacetum cinerariifolium]
MDEALVPHAQRLRIGRSNFRLLSDIKSKESTLQFVYDALRICPFFKAFLITTNVPKIYMHEFWATTTVHHHAIRFKMDKKKHIVNLESFRDMLHICPRVPGQSFDEPPFEEEIIAFIRFLGHNASIRTLTDVIHKNTKKSNEMYYPRFTKVIIHHFMTKDPSIPRRNKVNWHYVKDDHMFSTVKMVSRHQNTQQFSALLHIELTNEEIRNSNAYKEYYAIATGGAPPKPKASVRKTRSSSDTSITPTVATGPRLTASAKGKQAAKAFKAKSLSALSEVAMTEAQQLKLVTKRSLQQTYISQPSGFGVDEGTSSIPGFPDVPTNKSKEELSCKSTDDKVRRDDDKDDDEEGGDDEHEYDDEEYDEETRNKESFDPIPQTPENSKDEGNCEDDLVLNVGGEERHVEEEEEDELYRDVNINQGRGIQETLEVKDSHVTLTPFNPDGQQQSSSVSSQFVTSMLNLTLDVGMKSIFETTSQLDVQTPTSVAPLPMTAPNMTPSTIATITTTSQAPILPTTAPSTIIQDLSTFGFDNRLRTLEANFFEFMQTNQENDEFLKSVDENIKKIIKEQVKEQVKVQVSKILLRIELTVNEQIKAEVLTRSSHSSKTSYVVAADLSEIELKKILIEKMEGNKSIQHSDEQKNLYKTLVEAYEYDKIILDTYEETVTLKRHRDDDADKDEEPSARPDRGVDTLTPELLAGPIYVLIKGSCKSLVELEYHLEEVFKATTDQLDWVNPEGQQYPHNLLKPLPLIPNNQGRRIIPFKHFINNDLEYLRRGASSCKYTTFITKTKAADYGHIKWIEDLVPKTMWIEEPIGYDKHALWAVSHWGNINSSLVLLDEDKLHKFKEGNFKRLHIQDIEDMLLLLVQGKLTNLTVKERFAFNVSLRMFTKSIVIQRRVEDLLLGVKSYQKKLNLTKPDTYQSDLKCKEAYTAYSNPRGFIYQNKDKKYRLMRIDELHKFSDGTLIDVRTALDNRLKGIRMQYLPQSIWRKSDKDRAAAMIQAIDKRLKTKRIMRSLEKFVGGRFYEGDFRMLQRTT